MRVSFQRNIHIINNLLNFCHFAGATDFNVQLNTKPDATNFEIRAVIPQLDPALLEELDDALKLKRMHEIEQNYWELTGGIDSDYELTLVGMMLDEAGAVYENETLIITAERKN